MGLDITAYSKVVRLPDDTDCYDPKTGDWLEDVVLIHVHPSFPHAAEGLAEIDPEKEGWQTPAVYSTAESESFPFCAGSYGGYSEFREALAGMSNLTPETIWRDETDQFRNVPFYELIHFSDCCGAIGPVAARNLLEDFRQLREAFVSRYSDFDDGWFVQKYDAFTRGLELAADDGLLDFH